VRTPQNKLSLIQNFHVRTQLLACLFCTQSLLVFAAPDLEQMSLEQLMNISVIGASKYE